MRGQRFVVKDLVSLHSCTLLSLSPLLTTSAFQSPASGIAACWPPTVAAAHYKTAKI